MAIITHVAVTYSDGQGATFTGQPVDLTQIPAEVSEVQPEAVAEVTPEVAPEVVAETTDTSDSPSDAPVEATVEVPVEEVAQ